MGSKSRIAKHILPIILKNRKPGQYYVEPFVGGCNSIDKVVGNRIAGDVNEYLISMWKGLQSNKERVHEIPKSLYDTYRSIYNANQPVDSDVLFMVGWIGWMASFNGRFFDGGYSGTHGSRNYIDEQIRNTEKQIEKIRDVEFHSCSYLDLPIPDDSIIYCDIPYKDTKQYSASRDFNYELFWDWCRKKSKEGHTVFVSEYSAPSDFKCVWSMEITNAMNTTKTYKPIEKLFTL